MQLATTDRTKALVALLQPYLNRLPELIAHIGATLASDRQAPLIANAQCFMNIFSSVVMSWMWLRQANTASKLMTTVADDNQQRKDYLEGKLRAAEYYFHWELPLIERDFGLLLNVDEVCNDMQADWF
jgi:butyryl-CoA dehydrogenase